MAKQHPLNDRQRRFAEFVVGGDPASVAYKKSGYAATGNAAEVSASQLLRNPKVSAYLAELRKPQKEKAIATRQRKREILAAIMEGKTKGATVADRIRAVQVDNLMTGDNKPIKVEGEITLKRVLDAIGGDCSPGVNDKEFD